MAIKFSLDWVLYVSTGQYITARGLRLFSVAPSPVQCELVAIGLGYRDSSYVYIYIIYIYIT